MKSLRFGLCWLALITGSSAQSLDTVLARMDKAAPSFRAVSANVKMVTFTALLSDTETETGTLQMQRLKPGNVRAILAFTGGQGDARTIAFMGKKLGIYTPKLKTYQDVPFDKTENVVSQFLLLGFGSSGQELLRGYTIKFMGLEKLSGRDTSKLLLEPKDPSVRQKLQKVEMWIPNDSANPIQQQFYQSSGNYQMLTYTDITINPVMKKTLELKLPPDTTKDSH